MIALLLALQLTLPSPCPPAWTCTIAPIQLDVSRQLPPATAIANPARPAEWFWGSSAVAVGTFEGWAVATHHETLSQVAQHASRDHAVVRWSIVVTGALLIWHLAWSGPL